jgi:hypothetical protein
MVTAFWYEQAVVLVNFLASGTTVNSNHYAGTLRSVSACLHQVCPTGYIYTSEVLLLHDNARPHTSVHTTNWMKSAAISTQQT